MASCESPSLDTVKLCEGLLAALVLPHLLADGDLLMAGDHAVVALQQALGPLHHVHAVAQDAALAH